MHIDLYPTHRNPLLNRPASSFPREIAVIGAGTIGPDIGYYFKSALPSVRLVLVDVAQEPLEKAREKIHGYIQKAVDKKKMKPDYAEAVGKNIVYTRDYALISKADLVLEAATENLKVKQSIVDQVETLVRSDTIITSNTSSIPAERIFSNARMPQRMTVTHFFAPAWRNPAVEVITWEAVDRKIVDYLRWVLCMTGKVPIVSRSEICFILDRIFDNWCNEAAHMLETATAAQIDQTAQEFVHAGPFSVLNLARGNPIIVETNTLQMEEGTHYRPAHILRSVESWETLRPGQKVEVGSEMARQVQDRLLGVLFSQSFDVINREIGTHEDLNLGCEIALGFKRGPLDIMRDLGDSEVKRIIRGFQKLRPGMPGLEGDVKAYQDFNRTVLVDEIDGVKIITIRRPHYMNALNEEVTQEILEVLKRNEADPSVQGFVITGYGPRAFCAGAEIGKFPEVLGDMDASVQYCQDCSRLLRYLDQAEKPVVAAVNGMALGGGFELAIRCHRIVAATGAWFQFPEVTLGILPGIGGLVVPYRRWPHAACMFHDLIRLAVRLKAEKARDLGIVASVTDGYASLIEAAVCQVKEMGGDIPRISDHPVPIAPPHPMEGTMAGELHLSDEVLAIITQAIEDAATASSFDEALEIGYAAFGRVSCTSAAREGISAFLAKRSPRFTS